MQLGWAKASAEMSGLSWSGLPLPAHLNKICPVRDMVPPPLTEAPRKHPKLNRWPLQTTPFLAEEWCLYAKLLLGEGTSPIAPKGAPNHSKGKIQFGRLYPQFNSFSH